MKLGYDDLIASLWEAGAATASHFSHWLRRRARPSSRIHRNRAGTSRLFSRFYRQRVSAKICTLRVDQVRILPIVRKVGDVPEFP